MAPGLAQRRLWVAAGLVVAMSPWLFPLQNPDLWWHLRAGREWLASGRIPSVESWSHTLSGRPWVDFEWLVQGLYALIFGAAGWPGLMALKLLVLGAAAWTTAATVGFYRLPAAAGVVAALAVGAGLLPLADLRPDNFSVLGFALLLLILERRRLGKGEVPGGAPGLAAFFALWANLHLGVVYGLAMLTVYAVFDRRRSGGLLLLGAAALGSMSTPHTASLVKVLGEHAQAQGVLREVICEWQPPRLDTAHFEGYWMILAASTAAAARRLARRQPFPLPLACTAAFTGVSALLSQRHASFFVLAAIPALAAAVQDEAPGAVRAAGRAAAALLAVFSLAKAAQVTWRPGAALMLEPAARVADFLEREKVVLAPLKAFHPWGDGGYFAWRLPEYRVFYDGRYLFHGLLAETSLALKSPESWERLLRRRGVDLAVMRRRPDVRAVTEKVAGAEVARPYDRAYFPQRDWAVVYWDGRDAAYARRLAVPAAWLKEREYRWLKPDDSAWLAARLAARTVPCAELARELARFERESGLRAPFGADACSPG